MGGNALKKCKSVRLSQSKYKIIESYVLKEIQPLVLNSQIFVPRYSNTKTSFGDLDVIIVVQEPSKFREQVVTLFGAREIVKSDHVYSMDFNIGLFFSEELAEGDSFQVDFIVVSPEKFRISCFYFSFNDFGAILGGLFKNWGFSYGGLGLSYDVCYNSDRTIMLEKLFVTSNVEEICRLAGLDTTLVNLVFDSQYGGESTLIPTTLFDLLVASPLFRPDYWCNRSINWNHRERVRALIRPMYQEFLFEYIPKKYGISLEVVFSSITVKQEFISKQDKDEYVTKVLASYNLFEKKQQLLLNHQKKLDANAKFSGVIINGLTGLENRELGDFICYLKKQFPLTFGSVEWLSNVENTQSLINRLIGEEWGKYKETV